MVLLILPHSTFSQTTQECSPQASHSHPFRVLSATKSTGHSPNPLSIVLPTTSCTSLRPCSSSTSITSPSPCPPPLPHSRSLHPPHPRPCPPSKSHSPPAHGAAAPDSLSN